MILYCWFERLSTFEKNSFQNYIKKDTFFSDCFIFLFLWHISTFLLIMMYGGTNVLFLKRLENKIYKILN